MLPNISDASCQPSKPAGLATFSLAMLGLMVVVPFLISAHHHPIASFSQEWVACAFGLLALAFLAMPVSAAHPEIPEITFLPLALALLGIIQFALLPHMVFIKVLAYSLCLLWAALLAILGHWLVRELGMETLMHSLSSALLIGALLQAIVVILQVNQLVGPPWIFSSVGGFIVGNIGQRNNLCNYLWLGIAACIYLRGKNAIGPIHAALAITALAFLTLLAGSRAVWFYASALVILGFLAHRRSTREEVMKRILYWSAATFLACTAFQCLISIGMLDLLAGFSQQSAGSRLLSSGGSDPARMSIWRGALLMWQEHPFAGVGVGCFTPEFFQHVLEIRPVPLSAMPEHAHNLFLHLLAETGIAGLALLVIFGARWLLPLLQLRWQCGHWFALAVLLILLLHSGVEYPLWYTFFLGPAALLCGALSSRNRSIRLGPNIRSPVLAASLILSAGLLLKLGSDYQTLENAVSSGLMLEGAVEDPKGQNQTQAIRHSLYAPYLDLIMASSQSENGENLEQKLAHCERSRRLLPMSRASFKCVHLLALAGKKDEARLLLQKTVTAFPNKAAFSYWYWNRQIGKSPEIDWILKEFPSR